MSRASSWATLAAYRFLRLLPVTWTSAIGAGLGHIYALNADWRGQLWFKRVVATVSALTGQSHKEARRLAYRQLRNSGRVTAEFANIDRCAERVTFSGLEHVRRLDKPVLIVSIHTGNWEIAAAPLVLHGKALTALYDPPADATVHRLARETRLRMLSRAPGSRLIPASPRAGRELVRAARRGENILIYVDEYRDGLIWCPPLGRALPDRGNRILAARLARTHDMILLPVHVVRTDGLRFDIRVHAPIPVPQTSHPNRDAATAADGIAEFAERCVHAHLDQWYWLPEFRPDRDFAR